MTNSSWRQTSCHNWTDRRGSRWKIPSDSIFDTIETHLAIIERIEKGVGDVHSVTSVSMLRHKSVTGNLSLIVRLRSRNWSFILQLLLFAFLLFATTTWSTDCPLKKSSKQLTHSRSWKMKICQIFSLLWKWNFPTWTVFRCQVSVSCPLQIHL